MNSPRENLLNALLNAPGGILTYPEGVAAALSMATLTDEVKSLINGLLNDKLADLSLVGGWPNGTIQLEVTVGPVAHLGAVPHLELSSRPQE